MDNVSRRIGPVSIGHNSWDEVSRRKGPVSIGHSSWRLGLFGASRRRGNRQFSLVVENGRGHSSCMIGPVSIGHSS